ncbi:MAG: ABC transporter substrate-binding protein [Frankia sp.]|nr:ABC transporter substrate-binding protein [Frankia sp.]
MRSRTHRTEGGGHPPATRAGRGPGRGIVRRTLATATAVGMLAVLAACGDDDSDSSGSTPPAAPTSAAPGLEVPEDFQDGLTVATDASYAPNEFFDEDGETIIGMDIDLINALGEVLGVEVTVENAGFDEILPGLASGKYDVGMSSFTDTKEREEVVDFVTYFEAGTSFFTSAADPVDITGLDDLCGLSVAVEIGTTQSDDARAQDAKCREEGKPGVTVQDYPDQNAANLAVTSGRAQLSMADSPVADYQVELSNGELVSVGEPYGTAPYGIAVPKDSGLADPMLGALETIMENGTYAEILEKWGVSAGAIDSPVINGAID